MKVHLIELWKVSRRCSEYISTIPEGIEHHPAFITFTILSGLVHWLSDLNNDFDQRRRFFERNNLPSAIVDDDDWLLTNPNDFWPSDYYGVEFRNDLVALLRLLENMKTKTFNPIMHAFFFFMAIFF